MRIGPWALVCCVASIVPTAHAQFDAQRDNHGDSAPHEELLLDPELEDAPVGTPPAPSAMQEGDERTRVRALLHARFGVDTAWSHGLEEVWEATHIGLLEMTHHASAHVRLELGMRARFQWASRDGSAVGLDVHRYTLDAVPTAAYVDATLAPGFHARLGYQMIELGRMDFSNAANQLSVLDLRSGPTTIPEAAEIAQPAARIDWDLASWLALRAYYVPFFRPHQLALVGSDYGLPLTADDTELMRFLEQGVDRSWVPELAMGGMRALGPEPSFAHPQGAVRMTARSPVGELSLNAGTAIEKLPAFTLAPFFVDFLDDPENENRQAQFGRDIAAGRRPISAAYNRYATASVDGSVDLAPFQLGAEVAYMWNRTLYASRTGAIPQPGRSDMVHGALKVELVDTPENLVTFEAFMQHAVDNPEEPDRQWFSMSKHRVWRGIAAFGRWSPFRRLSLELLAVAFTGPSWMLAPRAQWEAAKTLFLELGGFFVSGRGPVVFGAPRTALGAVFDGIDQVFVGVRWVP